MVQGMSAPPVVAKPQPKPQLGATSQNPIPEFMWCQRSDYVFVTIKVADCVNANVLVTPEHVLEFRGTGHGMCGQRDYRLSIALAGAVVSAECLWFVSGASVRVRLLKEKAGPYWGGLLAGKQKMVQLKVDWASWLDEDEESERSAAPTGFDTAAMKGAMVGSDKDPLYRDLDRFDSTTSPDEGEETNSIMIDEGLNSIDAIQIKFRALEYEKEQTSKTKSDRYDLRRRTREAVLFAKQRENDHKYGRPVRELTKQEEELIAGSDGLYEKLKAERQSEKHYWLSKWWHVRRPEKFKIDAAEPLARDAASTAIAAELAALQESGGDIHDERTRRGIERRVFILSRQAALDEFDQYEHQTEKPEKRRQDQEGRDLTARDMGARITREEIAKALGEPMPDLARSLRLKQFADPRPDDDKPQPPPGYAGDDDEEEEPEDSQPRRAPPPVERAAPVVAKETAEVEEEDEEPELELQLELNEGADGGDGELELEENEETLELEANEENQGTVV